jgi:hypothetical protein
MIWNNATPYRVVVVAVVIVVVGQSPMPVPKIASAATDSGMVGVEAICDKICFKRLLFVLTLGNIKKNIYR